MKTAIAYAFGIFSISIVAFAQSLDLPSFQGFVNDFTGVLSDIDRSVIEADLRQFERETSNEIAVAIVPDLQGIAIEDYAVQLFEKWSIGKKNRDNGILFIIAIEERKARIEVGYGLEGALTDGDTGLILDTAVIPHFKEEKFTDGITGGVAAIKAAIQGEYEPVSQSRQGETNFSIFIFFIPLFLSYFGSFLGRSKHFWPGGVLGFVLGGGITWMIYSISIMVLVGGIFWGILGLIFDYIVSRNYQARKKRGLPTDFWHSGGGFFGGGGSGGFGGFGGGFSGGGGASRGW